MGESPLREKAKSKMYRNWLFKLLWNKIDTCKTFGWLCEVWFNDFFEVFSVLCCVLEIGLFGCWWTIEWWNILLVRFHEMCLIKIISMSIEIVSMHNGDDVEMVKAFNLNLDI